MNELIPIKDNDNGQVFASARVLHGQLNVKTRFSLWVTQNFKHFRDSVDFTRVVSTTVVNNGATRELVDYEISVEMAKHIAMMTGTEKGVEVRDYFIQVEKAWNSPDMVMKRALQYADKKIVSLQDQIALNQPKVLFAEIVESSQNSVAVKVLATLLKQNGINIGQNRMFQWLRDNQYLSSREGKTWNMPTQKAMDLKLFELKPNTFFHNSGVPETNYTPLVTGKGQLYFIDKFKQELMEVE